MDLRGSPPRFNKQGVAEPVTGACSTFEEITCLPKKTWSGEQCFSSDSGYVQIKPLF